MNSARLLPFILLSFFFSINIIAEDCENYDESGSCGEECPEGMVKYNPPCGETTMSQKTCRRPTSRSMGVICDYIRCDCPEPMVLDEATNACVMVDQCSDQSKVTE